MKKISMRAPSLSFLLLSLVALSLSASAQTVEVNGGYAHVSGDQGLDGFNIGIAAWFTPRISVAADYDRVVDTSRIGIFELTQTGLIVSRSTLQNFLVGPRFFFQNIESDNKYLSNLRPFAELQFGISHLNSHLQDQAANVDQSASDNAFSWMLGGGADYKVSPHWAGRFKLDLLRTHLAETGQSRLRLGLGVVYTLGER
jgi:hypothetical protein